MNKTFICPVRDHQAVGDGRTDDRRALQAAFDEAAQTGLRVESEKHQFGILGQVRVSGIIRPHIGFLSIKQLSLAIDPNVRTLLIDDCQRIRMDVLQIDRGAETEAGSLNEAAGLWVYGGDEHEVYSLEVFGGGLGSGAVFSNVRKSLFEGIHVHDLVYDQPGADDDRVMGFVLMGSEDCVLVRPNVHNLTGNDASYPLHPVKNTRGLALSRNKRIRIEEPNISRCDQAIDITGDGWNIAIEVLGGTINDCGMFAVKLANCAIDCKVRKVTATNCGLAPFVISGPSQDTQTFKTTGNLFEDCKGINTGSNRINVGTPAAFRVMRAAFGHEFPKDTTFRRCEAIDDQPAATMQFGFHSEVPGQKFEECSSRGHITAPYGGDILPGDWNGGVVAAPTKPVEKKGGGGGGGCAVLFLGLIGSAGAIAEKLA